MGRTAGARDDDPDPAARRLLGIAEQRVGRSVRRHDPQLRRERRARRGPRRPPRASESPTGSHRRCRRRAEPPLRHRVVLLVLIAAVGPSAQPRLARACARARERRRRRFQAPSGGPSCGVRTPRACRTCGGGRRGPREQRTRRSTAPAAAALAEHVDDGGRCQRVRRAERQPADRPDVLLELRRRGAFDRPVTAVVDAGASSLTTRDPSARRNSSTVSVPTRPIAVASRSPIAVAAAATSRAPARARRIRPGCPRHAGCGRPGRSRSGRRSRERRRPTARPRTGSRARPAAPSRAPRPSRPSASRHPRRRATRTCERPSYPPVVAFSRSGRPRASSTPRRAGHRSSEPRATARPRNPSARRTRARRAGPG